MIGLGQVWTLVGHQLRRRVRSIVIWGVALGGLGALYVALGYDKTVYGLKGKTPVNSEQERLFMVKAVSFVKDAFVSQGAGILDWEQEFREMRPDVLVVNEDGNTLDKQSCLLINKNTHFSSSLLYLLKPDTVRSPLKSTIQA